MTHNIVITGVGGTGVVTIGAVLAMAAHLDGKGAGMMEMAGLAQKGGAVHIHCRIGKRPEDITAIRVAVGEMHTLIGGDLVVSAGSKTTELMAPGQSCGVVNTHEIITGDFTRDPNFFIPGDRLRLSLEAKLGAQLKAFDASALAEKVFGDGIYSNMMLLGASWQMGQVPIARDAILKAVELNGAKVAENQRAFEVGRWAALNGDKVAKLTTDNVVELPKSIEEIVDFRAEHLTQYQSARFAKHYRKYLGQFEDPSLREAVAKGYHKVLCYKDEYEVARLLQATRAKASLAFEGELELTYHLAPPALSKQGPGGRPEKRTYSERMNRVWPILARLKGLRGTPFDPFGYTHERRMERQLIKQYRRDMAEVLKDPSRNLDAACALAELPLQVKGFGPVKAANAEAAEKRRAELLEAFRAGARMDTAAQ